MPIVGRVSVDSVHLRASRHKAAASRRQRVSVGRDIHEPSMAASGAFQRDGRRLPRVRQPPLPDQLPQVVERRTLDVGSNCDQWPKTGRHSPR